MENLMANLTNGTLALRSGADFIVLCASRLLADFFTHYRSDLNVPREDTYIFTLILILKNAIVCHGIYRMFPVSTTTQLLIGLSLYSFVFFRGDSVLNLTLVWATFAVVFFWKSPVMTPFYTSFRFIMSVTTLLVLPVGFEVPCTVECVVDILLIIHVTWNLLRTFLGPIDSLISYCLVEVTAAMMFLAIDIALDTKGLIFIMVSITEVSLLLIIDSYRRRKVVYFFVMIIVYVFCLREQYLIYKNRSANITPNIKIDLPIYPKTLTDEGK